jgi:phospholipase/lecithinase/hemolysin
LQVRIAFGEVCGLRAICRGRPRYHQPSIAHPHQEQNLKSWSTFVSAAFLAMTMLPAQCVTAQQREPIRQVVSFGDSLSDAGTYWVRFTTNPGLTFAQLLALHFDRLPPLPNQHMDRYADAYRGQHGSSGPGGLNYAEGGARVSHPYSTISQDPEGKPISAVQQLKHYLGEHAKFAPDQLVTLYIGVNDAAYGFDPDNAPELVRQLRAGVSPSADSMRSETARVEQAADDTVQLVGDMRKHGAARLLVFKMMDLGDAPKYPTVAAQDFARALGHAFNARLLAKLPADPAHILVIDTEAFEKDLLAHAASYGFTHGAHEDACGNEGRQFCFPETEVSADAGETYVFAGKAHLTTHANRLLAEYVLKQLADSPLN